MQAGGHHHCKIGETIFGIAQHIFNDAGAFNPSNGVFNPDPDAGDALILLFLGVSQLSLARFFFG